MDTLELFCEALSFLFYQVSCQATLALLLHEEINIVTPVLISHIRWKAKWKRWPGSTVVVQWRGYVFKWTRIAFVFGALRHGSYVWVENVRL